MVIKLYVYIPVPVQIGDIPEKHADSFWHLVSDHNPKFTKALFHHLSKRKIGRSARWN
jgi:hypothetical protein